MTELLAHLLLSNEGQSGRYGQRRKHKTPVHTLLMQVVKSFQIAPGVVHSAGEDFKKFSSSRERFHCAKLFVMQQDFTEQFFLSCNKCMFLIIGCVCVYPPKKKHDSIRHCPQWSQGHDLAVNRRRIHSMLQECKPSQAMLEAPSQRNLYSAQPCAPAPVDTA